jgi:prophage regulatory protein
MVNASAGSGQIVWRRAFNAVAISTIVSALGKRNLEAIMQSLIERLRSDLGKKTFGELVQEREAAAFEIEKLTRELAQHRAPPPVPHQSRPARATVPRPAIERQTGSRILLRLRDVCEMVGLSRSTIYSAMANGRFPRAIRVGARSVRWRSADVGAWLAAQEADNV